MGLHNILTIAIAGETRILQILKNSNAYKYEKMARHDCGNAIYWRIT
jgi:hypothetical protein